LTEDIQKETTAGLAAAIDASEQGLDLFRSAAQLASLLKTDLEATFVGNSDLRKFAELPFGNTISIATGLRRAFDRSTLDTVSRADRQRILEVNKELNRRFQISCTTCHEETSSRMGVVHKLTMSNRFVLTHGASQRQRASAEGTARTAEQVNIVMSALSGDAALIQQEIAQCVCIAETLHCVPKIVIDESLRSRVLVGIGELGETASSDVGIEAVSPYGIDAFASVVSRLKPALVIVPVELTDGSEIGLQALLDKVDCPLLLVNSG